MTTIVTRENEVISLQITSEIYPIADLDIANFKLENEKPFYIKNDGVEIYLDIRLKGMPANTFTNTRIKEGYAEELVIEIKADATKTEGTYNLKYAL